jgi:predicted unusual protein kinase regulating ubiquinone biosynthesis (AarF/ABC1/UbiB family)/nucleotide-binding universal stress UspA family protein
LIERILVATDRSDTATRAVEWAAEMAERYSAELLVLQVVGPEHVIAGAADGAPAELRDFAARLRGRARLEYESDAADAIVRVAEEERADVVVVGNRSMRDRTEFLLASVPNRVSHSARCHVVIVNTENAAAPRAPRPPDEPVEPHDGELLARAAQILRVVARNGVRRDAESSARRLRETLEQLGPTFAKLGQILSTRPDLLPEAVVQELAGLQDRVTPLTEAEAVAAMERELRVPWEDVFERLEPVPMAAGTIAQVHRAVLVGGQRVVVKVQRPAAQDAILRDLGLLERFAARAGERDAFRQVIDVPAIIANLSASLRRELDFRHEARNLERMREALAGFDRLGVPAVHGDLSTARLLVMDEIQGIPIADAPEGGARREAGRQLLEAFYQQVLAEGFFHADPHPGNLMWADGRIYLLDLGMVGEVGPELRESLLLMLLAFWQEDSDFLAELMLALAPDPPPGDFDLGAYRAELAALVARYRHVSLQELRLGPLLEELTQISLRFRVGLPAALAMVGKAFGQVQSTVAALDPTLDPFAVAEAFYRRRLVAGLRQSVNPRELLFEAQKLRVRAQQLLTGLERGSRLEVPGVPELERAIERAGRRLALGLCGATALAATAAAAGRPERPRWAVPAFAATAAVLNGGLLADLHGRR